MNYSILLAVKKNNPSDVENKQQWDYCKTNLSTLSKQNKDVRLLRENVLLIPLNKNLNALSKVLSVVCRFGYSYLILNEETMWHEVTKQV